MSFQGAASTGSTRDLDHPWRPTNRLEEMQQHHEIAGVQSGNQQGPFNARLDSYASVTQAHIRGHGARVASSVPESCKNRRRRPRVGIVAGSDNDNGSNLNSLELALQDTSKTSWSTSSTTSNSRSPGRSPSRSPLRNPQDQISEVFEDEHDLHRNHPQCESPIARGPKYSKVSVQSSKQTWQSPVLSNPSFSGPDINSDHYLSRQSTSTNPFVFSTASSPSRSYPTISDKPVQQKLDHPILQSDCTSQSVVYKNGLQGKRNADTKFANVKEEQAPPFSHALHELCEEATSPQDMTWRNALYLLAMQPELSREVDAHGRTALHVACKGRTARDEPPQPPPAYIIQALLVANPSAAQLEDADCRIPIHYIASTSGDSEILQILVEANPASIVANDAMGLIPLHLYLLNEHTLVAVQQVQILLGMTVPLESSSQVRPGQEHSVTMRQRRGDHLNLTVDHLDYMRRTNKQQPRWQPKQRWNLSEKVLTSYPEDVRQCLRRLRDWERKQSLVQEDTLNSKLGLDKDVSFQSSSSTKSILVHGPNFNPAAISAPQERQLPLHMIIERGLTDVHLQSSRVERQQYNAKNSRTVGQTNPSSSLNQQHTLLVIVRLLISAHPQSLNSRNANGHTPLLLAMLAASDVLPSQELLELLLGKRTAGYESLPTWARDVPFPLQHAYTRHLLPPAAERYCNPALVAALDTGQLPLHIAAEEWGDHSCLIVAIYESYPGAKNVQDARGRTPLHLLLNNYRRIMPHPGIVAMLLTERVARSRDDEGRLPFDLLVDAAPYLPQLTSSSSYFNFSRGAGVCADPQQVFHHFFQSSIITDAGEPDAQILRHRAAADLFLWRLRSLPAWIRRQACGAQFVQELLVRELASPAKCAFILIQGLVQILLIISFHRLTNVFIESAPDEKMNTVLRFDEMASQAVFDGTEDEVLKHVFAEPSLRYEAWNTLTMYVLSAMAVACQAVFAVLSCSLNEFQHLFLFSICRWLDLMAVLAVVASSVMISEGMPDEHVLTVATVATGMLWCSFVGFVSNWWYGMAYFMGSFRKTIQIVVWPAVAAMCCIVGFAEMFYLMANMDCSVAVGSTPICSLRGSYRLVYFLLAGEPIVDITSSATPSVGMASMAVLFTLLIFLLFLTVAFATMLVASKVDTETVAIHSYWEPKLALVLSSKSARTAAARYKTGMWIPRPSQVDRLEAYLEDLWGTSICLLLGIKKNQYWYATNLAPLKKLLLQVVLVFAIPVWLVIGLLTAGLLWPPQVRLFLFRPRMCFPTPTKSNQGKEFLTSQIGSVKAEIVNLKNMSYEQFHDIQQDIHQLKAIIAGSLGD